MENNSQDLYLIDLSYAATPADIVFELSTILEQEMAHSQKVYLKLGEVDLNQSQLLSIKSLINSINSSLNALSSESKQTELAAATIGINITAKEKDADPSAQYVPLTEHLEEDSSEKPEEKEIDSESVDEKTLEIIPETEETLSVPPVDSESSEIGADVSETNSGIIKAPVEDDDAIDEKELIIADIKEELNAEDTELKIEAKTEADSESESKEADENLPVDLLSSQLNVPENKEIQAQLDSIFDSETKLENILCEQEKYPLAQEAVDIEIPAEEELTEEDYLILKMPTKYVKQTVRSGQVIKFDGNILVVGDCHPGSELHASGDITVWGTLGGIAHAGKDGNTRARIRALQLNAIQLRVGEFFARRPDSLNVSYIEKTNSVTPEEARIINDNIVILKLTD